VISQDCIASSSWLALAFLSFCRGPCAAAHGDENPRLGRHARAGDQQASAPADLPGDAAEPVHLAGGLLVCRRNHSSAMRRHIPVPAGKAPPLAWARSIKHHHACPSVVGQWDAVGLSWSSWDMIQNLRRADQAPSEATDATRTERGSHAAGNEETAGQWLFRWTRMGGL
jgi:hypothetical protein